MAKANKSFGYTDAFPSRFRDLADEKDAQWKKWHKHFQQLAKLSVTGRMGKQFQMQKVFVISQVFSV